MIFLKLFVATVLFFLLMFFTIREKLGLIIIYCLNTSNRKKRRKGQSLWEWLSYKRYRDIIPKKFIIWYWSNHIDCVLVILAMAILVLLGLDTLYYVRIPLVIYVAKASIPALYVHFMYLHPRSHDRYNPSRFMDRPKRNKK